MPCLNSLPLALFSLLCPLHTPCRLPPHRSKKPWWSRFERHVVPVLRVLTASACARLPGRLSGEARCDVEASRASLLTTGLGVHSTQLRSICALCEITLYEMLSPNEKRFQRRKGISISRLRTLSRLRRHSLESVACRSLNLVYPSVRPSVFTAHIIYISILIVAECTLAVGRPLD